MMILIRDKLIGDQTSDSALLASCDWST